MTADQEAPQWSRRAMEDVRDDRTKCVIYEHEQRKNEVRGEPWTSI